MHILKQLIEDMKEEVAKRESVWDRASRSQQLKWESDDRLAAAAQTEKVRKEE